MDLYIFPVNSRKPDWRDLGTIDCKIARVILNDMFIAKQKSHKGARTISSNLLVVPLIECGFDLHDRTEKGGSPESTT